MRRQLGQVEIRGEDAACARTWNVVRMAFAVREPVARPSHWGRVAAVSIAISALLAASLSPPGRAVLDEIREVVGVERAQPALFSLPTAGRLLVSSDAGVWVAQRDGSKRLLGPYREASWSPLGRFVVAARENELAALEPDGDVRWTLARPDVKSPRWTGTETDTRIAYLDRTGLRIVAGDGTDDQPLCAVAADRNVAPAWRPGAGFVVALATPSGAVLATELDGCLSRRLSAHGTRPRRLEWSTDGRRLLSITRRTVSVRDVRTGSVLRRLRGVAAAFPPASSEPVLILRRGTSSAVVLAGRMLFSAAGELRDLTVSPDGRWVVVSWPAADQWVFLRSDGTGIRAVSNVSEQFRSRSFPRIEGWCCVRD